MKVLALLAIPAAMLALAAPAISRADDSPGGCGAEECIDGSPVVPSIDPDWSASFVPPAAPRLRAPIACIPTNVVFYVPISDWLRVMQRMALNASPCANYYVSIPALAADKTKPRPNQAPAIRALGPHFHAMSDVQVSAWTSWVAAGNGTWYDAGVEARRRMAAAGYDVSAGDIWALNELSSSVRAGTGTSRANMREFARGLYDGDGGPAVRGLVWVSNFGQATTFFDTYKTNLKSWLRDSAFWADMAQYTRFFSQEVYGRVTLWAVPGTTMQDRLPPLDDYVEHLENLASAGAYELGDPSAYLETADAPTGNAAWPATGLEWPSPPVDYTVAAAYAAAQVYAFRSDQAGRGEQMFGFSWQPSQVSPPISDITTKTAFILDRIAAAVRASDRPSDTPGVAACGTDFAWCTGDLPGAAFNTGWRTFEDWTQPIAQPSSAVVQQDTPTVLTLQAVDPDPQPISFAIATAPAHGTVTGDGSAAVTYTPEAGYSGPDSFTFRASDGILTSGVATVSIRVNAPPLVDAGPDVATPWDVPVTLTGTATDPDGDPSGLVAHWDFGDGATADTFQSTHAYGKPGTYTATLTVTDSDGGIASDTTTVTVSPRASSMTLVVTPELDAANASVSATFTDAVDKATALLAGHDVTFSAGGATCAATTDATGAAGCALPAPSLGPVAVAVRFDGDRLYRESVSSSIAVVYAYPAGGAFVVGDASAGRAMTFWSPSWWATNALSGGAAPASFKGFASRGETGWIASPGFDHAPASVPEWMPVLLASRVQKSGDGIAVTAASLVVVHVDWYDPAVGGRGTVVSAPFALPR